MAQADPREALRHAIAYEHRLYLESHKHELLAARWQQRAELALRRGEQALASEALQRKAAETRLAHDYQAEYVAQTQAIRSAKHGLNAPAAISPPISAATQLDQLARDDRLERDLTTLKARLAADSPSAQDLAVRAGLRVGPRRPSRTRRPRKTPRRT